jgi:TonB family protein
VRAAGILISALAHGAVVWLALQAPPWLRARPREPVPSVAVEIVTAAELAALEAALARGAAPAAPPPAPSPTTEPTPAAPAEREPAPVEPPAPAPAPSLAPSLAPAFDAAAPLGLDTDAPSRLAVEPPPRPRRPPPAERPATLPAPAGLAGRAAETRAGSAALGAAPSAAAAPDYGMAVRAAIAKARVYPRVARDRGLVGESRLLVIVDRDGRLVNARLLRSSGSRTLDEAALGAARNARLPTAPAELPGRRFSFEVAIAFTLAD